MRRCIALLHSEQESNEKKTKEVSNRCDAEGAEVRRLLAQKERLVVLANELTKQKESAIAAASSSSSSTNTNTVEELSIRINEVSAALEEVGRKRVATATTNDQLRDTLRAMLTKSQTDESNTTATLVTKTARLTEVSSALESAIATTAAEKEQTPVLEAKSAELSAREETLRKSLQEYAERFEHFQSSLNKSNELFSSFKRRMDEMARTINKYNKDNSDLDARSKEMTSTIADMKKEKSHLDEEAQKTERAISCLTGLVEALSKRLGIPVTNGSGCSPYCTCRCGAPLGSSDKSAAANPLVADYCVAAAGHHADNSKDDDDVSEDNTAAVVEQL